MEIRNVLWTGGWDSTFRILELVIIKKKRVRPYYIKSEERKSHNKEMKAMDQIRFLTLEKFPHTKELLEETVVVKKENISPLETNSNYYKLLKKKSFLGAQYIYLANFAENYNLNDLELSVHIDDRVYSFYKGI